jgi:hypothetical protein
VRPAPPPPDDDDEVIDLAEPDPEAEPERVPLFRIGETVHLMLKNPSPSLAIESLEVQRQYDDGTPVGRTEARGYGSAFLMKEMLGEESYRALLGCRTMTSAQFARIQRRVINRALGQMEGEDGSPNS